jgi:hypothetical protein
MTGRAKSCGLVPESTKDKPVAARSAADIPVVTPFLLIYRYCKAVSIGSVLLLHYMQPQLLLIR